MYSFSTIYTPVAVISGTLLIFTQTAKISSENGPSMHQVSGSMKVLIVYYISSGFKKVENARIFSSPRSSAFFPISQGAP